MPENIRFDADELQDIQWAQLMLMGIDKDAIPTLNQHEIAMLFAVHRIQKGQ